MIFYDVTDKVGICVYRPDRFLILSGQMIVTLMSHFVDTAPSVPLLSKEGGGVVLKKSRENVEFYISYLTFYLSKTCTVALLSYSGTQINMIFYDVTDKSNIIVTF